MKPNFVFHLAIFITGIIVCSAQGVLESSIPLDTLYANETKNVALFFPAPIYQATTGSDDFIFTFNRDKQQYYGLLKGIAGEESNLLVIDIHGNAYSYILKYQKNLRDLNYFLKLDGSIGNIKPKEEASQALNPNIEPAPDSLREYLGRFCDYLLNKDERIGNISKQYQGIELRIKNIAFDLEQLYFVLQIKNRSTLDYDLNFLKLYTGTRQKGKKKSVQKIELAPLYTENVPKKIKAGQQKTFVYVFEKFSLSDDRRIIVDMNEEKGERNIELKVSHRFINNPN